MDIEQPELPLAVYAFRYLADRGFPLPVDPRCLWHTGSSACTCAGCLLLQQRQCSDLFRGPCVPESEPLRCDDTIAVCQFSLLDLKMSALVEQI